MKQLNDRSNYLISYYYLFGLKHSNLNNIYNESKGDIKDIQKKIFFPEIINKLPNLNSENIFNESSILKMCFPNKLKFELIELNSETNLENNNLSYLKDPEVFNFSVPQLTNRKECVYFTCIKFYENLSDIIDIDKYNKDMDNKDINIKHNNNKDYAIKNYVEFDAEIENNKDNALLKGRNINKYKSYANRFSINTHKINLKDCNKFNNICKTTTAATSKNVFNFNNISNNLIGCKSHDFNQVSNIKDNNTSLSSTNNIRINNEINNCSNNNYRRIIKFNSICNNKRNNLIINNTEELQDLKPNSNYIISKNNKNNENKKVLFIKQSKSNFNLDNTKSIHEFNQEETSNEFSIKNVRLLSYIGDDNYMTNEKSQLYESNTLSIKSNTPKSNFNLKKHIIKNNFSYENGLDRKISEESFISKSIIKCENSDSHNIKKFVNKKLKFIDKSSNVLFKYEIKDNKNNNKNKLNSSSSILNNINNNFESKDIEFLYNQSQIVNYNTENNIKISANTKSNCSSNSSNHKNIKSKKNIILVPKIIVLVSYDMFYTQLTNLIKNLHFKTTNLKYLPLPYDNYIQFLLNDIPMPPRGIHSIEFSFLGDYYFVKNSKFNDIPYQNLDIKTVFYYFTIQKIISIYMYVLLEYNVFFFSSNISLITLFSETYKNLLFPFCYSKPYYPILPTSYFGILNKCNGGIYGINSTYCKDIFANYNIDTKLFIAPTCIVDIDNMAVDIVENKQNKFVINLKNLNNQIDNNANNINININIPNTLNEVILNKLTKLLMKLEDKLINKLNINIINVNNNKYKPTNSMFENINNSRNSELSSFIKNGNVNNYNNSRISLNQKLSIKFGDNKKNLKSKTNNKKTSFDFLNMQTISNSDITYKIKLIFVHFNSLLVKNYNNYVHYSKAKKIEIIDSIKSVFDCDGFISSKVNNNNNNNNNNDTIFYSSFLNTNTFFEFIHSKFYPGLNFLSINNSNSKNFLSCSSYSNKEFDFNKNFNHLRIFDIILFDELLLYKFDQNCVVNDTNLPFFNLNIFDFDNDDSGFMSYNVSPIEKNLKYHNNIVVANIINNANILLNYYNIYQSNSYELKALDNNYINQNKEKQLVCNYIKFNYKHIPEIPVKAINKKANFEDSNYYVYDKIVVLNYKGTEASNTFYTIRENIIKKLESFVKSNLFINSINHKYNYCLDIEKYYNDNNYYLCASWIIFNLIIFKFTENIKDKTKIYLILVNYIDRILDEIRYELLDYVVFFIYQYGNYELLLNFYTKIYYSNYSYYLNSNYSYLKNWSTYSMLSKTNLQLLLIEKLGYSYQFNGKEINYMQNSKKDCVNNYNNVYSIIEELNNIKYDYKNKNITESQTMFYERSLNIEGYLNINTECINNKKIDFVKLKQTIYFENNNLKKNYNFCGNNYKISNETNISKKANSSIDNNKSLKINNNSNFLKSEEVIIYNVVKCEICNNILYVFNVSINKLIFQYK